MSNLVPDVKQPYHRRNAPSGSSGLCSTFGYPLSHRASHSSVCSISGSGVRRTVPMTRVMPSPARASSETSPIAAYFVVVPVLAKRCWAAASAGSSSSSSSCSSASIIVWIGDGLTEERSEREGFTGSTIGYKSHCDL